MKHLAVILLTLALVVPAAIAHDASKHKGKATQGEITAVTGDTVELKTAAGNVRVSLTSKTKIEHGTQVVDRSHLKTGERVHVFGTKLPSGELVAREIVIGTADHTGAEHSKAGHPKKTTDSSTPKQ
jgi:hypothetical protein